MTTVLASSAGLGYFAQGGIFIYIIIACSLVSVAIMIWKALVLQEKRIIPTKLEMAILGGEENISSLEPVFRNDNSVLSRLCRLIAQNPAEDLVEAAASKELNRLRGGLNIIEVIITIAPLLGLLGTVSGLSLIHI